MLKATRVRRGILALAVVTAATVLPVRTAEGMPAVRLDEVATAPGATADLAYPSSHLGLRWTGAETDVLELRWRPASGPWSAWAPAPVSHDLGDEEKGILLSGLLVADDAVDAQVRVLSGEPRDIEIVGIDTEHGPRPLQVVRPRAAGAAQGSAVAQPSVVTRAEWGADESMRTGTPEFAPLSRMVCTTP